MTDPVATTLVLVVAAVLVLEYLLMTREVREQRRQWEDERPKACPVCGRPRP